MTYRGQVKNGVIVLEGPMPLEEGTHVRIEPMPQPDRSLTAIRRGTLKWVGPPGELQRLLNEVQEMREADLRLQEGKGE